MEFEIKWKIEGINYIEAKTKEEAEEKFEELDFEELGLRECDLPEIETTRIKKN